jgi:hypothetical protein
MEDIHISRNEKNITSKVIKKSNKHTGRPPQPVSFKAGLEPVLDVLKLWKLTGPSDNTKAKKMIIVGASI